MTGRFDLPQVAVFVLVSVRIAGTVISSPLLWGEAPARVRAALVVLLAMVTSPTQTVSAEFAASEMTLAIPAEFIIGVSIGMVVRIILAGVEIAGDAIGPAIGIQAGSVFDPAFQSTDSPVTRLLRYGALLVALISGAHRAVIRAIIGSFRAIPIATHLRPWMGASVISQAVSGAVAAGVALALPLIAILFLTHVALAFVSRAAPSIQIFSVGFALTLGVGVLTLTLALPDIFSILGETYSNIGASIEKVVAALITE